jgi:hypothetical protein
MKSILFIALITSAHLTLRWLNAVHPPKTADIHRNLEPSYPRKTDGATFTISRQRSLILL